MSVQRKNLHKAKLRRERIRAEKHRARSVPEDGILEPAPTVDTVFPPGELFASERALREIQASREGSERKEDLKRQAQDLAYDALETPDFQEALLLVAEALKLDPDCTDANRLMVSLLPMEPENRLLLMREVVKKAEDAMSEEFLRENTGYFWSVISTRPYMRAMQHLAELLAETGKLEEAVSVRERMLVLNPQDNQGMRDALFDLYLALNRPEGVRDVLSRYPTEENVLPVAAWARTFERWLSGALDEAQSARAHASKLNRFAERYLSGRKPLPSPVPEFYKPGSDHEAAICANTFGLSLKAHPGFAAWLRTDPSESG